MSTKQIDWNNYNYPPLLRVVHYDINDLPDELKRPIKFAHYTFILMLCTLIFNFISSIIVAITIKYGLYILVSILNIIIITPITFYGFYCGYRGLATKTSKDIYIYLGVQALAILVYIIFDLVGSANLEGWANFSRANGNGWWITATIVESVLWLFCIALGCYAWFLVYTNRDTGVAGKVNTVTSAVSVMKAL